MTVAFVMTNPRHHLAMFRPVLARLRHRDVGLRVVSFCELRGYRTPLDEIAELGAVAVRAIGIRFSKDAAQVSLVRRRSHGGARVALRALIWRFLVRPAARLQAGPAPDLVVLPNDVAFPYDRLTAVLHARRIAFLLMQEGIRFEPGGANGRRYGQGGAQGIAAWGPSSARYFAAVGVPVDRIHTVGNPRLDEIRTRDWDGPAAALREALGIWGPVLLYISNPIEYLGFGTAEEKHRRFSAFLEEAASFLRRGEVHLVVKIHPSESLEAFRAAAAASSCAECVTVVRDPDLYTLLALSRAVVVLASTAGLEALLFDRPLGVLETPGAGFLYDYVQRDAAIPLRVDGALGEGLAALLDDPPQRRQARADYVRDEVANLGRASEAAERLILEMMGRTA